jgi:hypothetical protein
MLGTTALKAFVYLAGHLVVSSRAQTWCVQSSQTDKADFTDCFVLGVVKTTCPPPPLFPQAASSPSLLSEPRLSLR